MLKQISVVSWFSSLTVNNILWLLRLLSIGENEVSVVLKGVVRAERLEDPVYYIREVLEKAKAKDLEKIYGIANWGDEEDFLKKVAEKKGRLLKV